MVLPHFRYSSLWHMIAAPVIWAAHFAAVYAWTAIACAKLNSVASARTGIAVFSAVALIVILWLGWHAWRQWDFPADGDDVHDRPTAEDRREFLGHAAWLLAVVSAIGVIFVTLPVLFIESCL
jgi:hypothetical protein